MPSISDLLERDCVVLIESTIPAHMTIAEWRRGRARHRVARAVVLSGAARAGGELEQSGRRHGGRDRGISAGGARELYDRR